MPVRQPKSPEQVVAVDNPAILNKNNSHAKSVSPKHRKVAPRRGRLQKQTDSQDALDDQLPEPVVQPVLFQEDGDIVEMQIERNGQDFASDAEPDSDRGTDSQHDTTQSDSDDSQSVSSEQGAEQSAEEARSARSSDRGASASPARAHRSHRRSMEDKLDSLSSSLQEMRALMMDRGMLETPRPMKNKRPTDRGKRSSTVKNSTVSDSVTTIYENVVPLAPEAQQQGLEFEDPEITLNIKSNRVSSSSDEPVDTSDEMIDVEMPTDSFPDYHQGPGNSRSRPAPQHVPSREEEMVCEAENSRARMLPTPGRVLDNFSDPSVPTTSQMDENYLIIGSHIDQTFRNKIVNFEYIDFAHLLPRSARDDDHWMELVSKGGQTYFVPVSDREQVGITSFAKWEQALHLHFSINHLN